MVIPRNTQSTLGVGEHLTEVRLNESRPVTSISNTQVIAVRLGDLKC